MNIQLTWFGQLRDVVGVPEEAATASDGASVADVLIGAAERHGEALQRILLRDGALSPTILVSLDDAQVMDAVGTVLEDGARLVIMAPISGG